MSASHVYVNPDREQFFDVGLFGWSDDDRHVGCGPGGRALGLLCQIGSWRDCRIRVVTDSTADYQQITGTFTNVTVEAELMLIDIDGFRWLENFDSISAFMQLCRFATLLDRSDITEYLDEKYGRSAWQRRYAEHSRRTNDRWADLVIEAGRRQLKIYQP